MIALVLLEISGCFWKGEMDFDLLGLRFDLSLFPHSFGFWLMFPGLALSPHFGLSGFLLSFL